MSEREAFEAWYKKEYIGFDDFTVDKFGFYEDYDLKYAWSIWQAALAHTNDNEQSQAQQTESKILSFDDNGQLVDKSQAQQESQVIRKAFICPACECVYADSPVSHCDCFENHSNTYIEGSIIYSPAPEGGE